jgi:hypothetical protein
MFGQPVFAMFLKQLIKTNNMSYKLQDKETLQARWKAVKNTIGEHGVIDYIDYWISDNQLSSFVAFLEEQIACFEDADGNRLDIGDYAMLTDGDDLNDCFTWKVGDILKVVRLGNVSENFLTFVNTNIDNGAEDQYFSMYGHMTAKVFCKNIKTI